MGSVVSLIPQLIGGSIQQENDRTTARMNIAELRRSSYLEQANSAAILQQGNTAAGLRRQAGEQAAGQARVALADSNVDMGSGTAAQLVASSAQNADLDASNIKSNALAQALGHQEVARRYDIQRSQIANKWGLDKSATSEDFLSPADGEYYGKVATSVLGAAVGMFGGGVGQ
jgi:hypothetical protein